MFDVTPDDVAQLNDTDLRELVGRLCEAELVSRGLSPAAVTWGGNQTASDGGLDVRVALPPGASIDGFIARASAGFQVKAQDMAKAAIGREMRPNGVIRPVIAKLADEAGSYVIASSRGSTADSSLQSRRRALSDALAGVPKAEQLHVDFYDRTRLATWVRRHPGLITWVREKVGRPLRGWRPYGPWGSGSEGVEAEYLHDDMVRLQLRNHRDATAQPVADAIDELRDMLAKAGKMVRLVGLSGVGKTRLVQALFDARIGARALPPSLAVYTNLSDDPDPQPTGLASDMIANRTRAVLIVDNCPPDLHRRLSDLCSVPSSTVSVLTIEYDVRDDQPEGTEVVTLDTSSPEVIEKLVARRYPDLSQVDARTIAQASGGNARIAIALAETVGRSETIAGLSDDELFQRLFRQRHDEDHALLRAAQACSLVYSFEGVALTGEEAELPRLALIADQAPRELYRHVSELLHRDLVQQRSVWRAVLPHAIANRLAARALDDTPYDIIDQQLVTGGTERLARSFSRRLSFLHDHSRAVAIVEQWLRPGGLLSDLSALNDCHRAMFENVAPVQPEAALTVLERAANGDSPTAAKVLYRYRWLLRSLAYDPLLFERTTAVLIWAATQDTSEREPKEAWDTFTSLFSLYLSGTHATVEQRLGVIERLLRSDQLTKQSLGLAALEAALEAMHFSSVYPFEFGSRSRDYGYEPSSAQDVAEWYGAALALIERLALTEGILKLELRKVLAKSFRGLWTSAHMVAELEELFRRFSADGFWREGWVACRQTIYFDAEQLLPENASRLTILESVLRPSRLPDRVRASVLGNQSGGIEFGDEDIDGNITDQHERLEAIARDLGAAVAIDEAAFAELLPDLLRGGNGAWAFGGGLAGASMDPRATWVRLVDELGKLSEEQRNPQILRGFLAELWEKERDLAHDLLDAALHQSGVVVFLPVLQSAVPIDARGVERLKRVLSSGQVPIWMYRDLALGRTSDQLAGRDLKDLLISIAEQPEGFDVALEILFMRLHSDRSAERQHEPELLVAGQELLRRVRFGKKRQRNDYQLAGVVRACLSGTEAGPIAAEVISRLRQAFLEYESHVFDNHDLLKALMSIQPGPVLDALFGGNDEENRRIVFDFTRLRYLHSNPADEIPCAELIAWCGREREVRFTLAASIVTFAQSIEQGSQVWSEQAKALLANAPDPKRVLTEFIRRFKPTSWSGSRAALIEVNARLLDILEPEVSAGLCSLLEEAKEQLARDVAVERKREIEDDRSRDERFE